MPWERQWAVPSSSGNGSYTVSMTPSGEYACSCHAWIYNRYRCRHIKSIGGEYAPVYQAREEGDNVSRITVRPTRTSPRVDARPRVHVEPVVQQFSFGVEVEFDLIERHSRPKYTRTTAHVEGFSHHDDGTVGTELTTPPFTSVRDASTFFKRMFHAVMSRFGVPLLKGHGLSNSIGQHHHLGVVPDPDTPRWESNKEAVALNVRAMLPFFIGLYGNDRRSDFKSMRAGSQSRSRIQNYCVASRTGLGFSHYDELSRNDLGTVEIRSYDANIPQVALTVARMELAIAKATVDRHVRVRVLPHSTDYLDQRRLACAGGFDRLTGIDPEAYWRFFQATFGREYDEMARQDGGLLDCEKEVIDLAVAKRLSVADLATRYRLIGNAAREYAYFKQMLSDPAVLYRHFTALGVPDEAITGTGPEAPAATATATAQANAPTPQPINPTPTPATSTRPARTRRTPTTTMTRLRNREDAEWVAGALNEHGAQTDRTWTADSIIEAPERFYLLLAGEERVGTAAFRLRTGRFVHLVVVPEQRGKGYAKKLCTLMLEEYGDCGTGQPATAQIHRDNTASQRTATALGFTLTERQARKQLQLWRLD